MRPAALSGARQALTPVEYPEWAVPGKTGAAGQKRGLGDVPHNHRAEYLTTEQRQQVNAAITEAGFPLDDFEQGRTDSEHTPNLKVFCVKHFDSGSFIFDRDGQRRVSIRRVGVATKPEVLTPRDWPGELKNFQQWLKLLRKEIEKRERAALDAGDVQAEKEQQGFREYKGDTYLVDGWVADGDSFKQAIQRVQDPNSWPSGSVPSANKPTRAMSDWLRSSKTDMQPRPFARLSPTATEVFSVRSSPTRSKSRRGSNRVRSRRKIRVSTDKTRSPNSSRAVPTSVPAG